MGMSYFYLLNLTTVFAGCIISVPTTQLGHCSGEKTQIIHKQMGVTMFQLNFIKMEDYIWLESRTLSTPSLDQQISMINVHQNHTEGLLGPSSGAYDSADQGEAQDPVFLSRSQVMLLLLVCGPHFEYHCIGKK